MRPLLYIGNLFPIFGLILKCNCNCIAVCCARQECNLFVFVSIKSRWTSYLQRGMWTRMFRFHSFLFQPRAHIEQERITWSRGYRTGPLFKT